MATVRTLAVRFTEHCNGLNDKMKSACPDRGTLNSPLLLTVGDLQKAVLEDKPKPPILALTLEAHGLMNKLQVVDFLDGTQIATLKTAIKSGRYASGALASAARLLAPLLAQERDGGDR